MIFLVCSQAIGNINFRSVGQTSIDDRFFKFMKDIQPSAKHTDHGELGSRFAGLFLMLVILVGQRKARREPD